MKIKEGGVMDIQNTYPEYDDWLKTNMQKLFESVEHIPKEEVRDIIEVAGRAIWQAAKAQAVPDLIELQERIAGHQYYHNDHGHMIVDMDDVVKEINGFDGWKAQAVPEGFVLVNAEQLSQWGHMANYAEQYGCPECFESRGYAHNLACEINEFFAVESQEPTND